MYGLISVFFFFCRFIFCYKSNPEIHPEQNDTGSQSKQNRHGGERLEHKPVQEEWASEDVYSSYWEQQAGGEGDEYYDFESRY